MNKVCIRAALAMLTLAAAAAQAADVGVSIRIAQPGVYGRIDVGRFPEPVLVMPSPVVVQRQVVREPVYLWVPPGHRRHWSRHCAQYRACGAPVYFVDDGWYRSHVMPPPRHPGDRGPGHGHGRGHRH